MTTAYDGFPGAVAVSRLSVYDWPTVDGRPGGGTPHLHLTCSEGYVVTGGEGAVQTLTTSGFEETPLRAGTVTWFTPGTIHRLVNHGGLQIIVVMQNSGLPEAGDAVLTLPPDRLTDPDTYAAAVRLPAEGSEQDRAVAARARRDLATHRFVELRDAAAAGDLEPLTAFHRAAVELVRPRLAGWESRWREGARAAATATRDQLAALGAGDLSHLSAARTRSGGPSATGRFGMCGRLDVYHDA